MMASMSPNKERRKNKARLNWGVGGTLAGSGVKEEDASFTAELPGDRRVNPHFVLTERGREGPIASEGRKR